ncbi:Integrase/recombinase xerD [Mycena sanguinolenta]|uniref:Integrase/recombinase xerD n=1 Tax=Mycena sanguinolenta TaxID=230812 RepID=A0A8H7CM39_9AGAR|nr:Integrase/recombinase xerD [Mycena sanguinolenta]
MPRPLSSHWSTWSSPGSPFVQRVPGYRQRSKLFIPDPAPVYRRPFPRRFLGRSRVRSKRYSRVRSHFSSPSTGAELGVSPLLDHLTESVAQTSPSAPPASHLVASGDFCASQPIAEPSLLSVESTAPLGRVFSGLSCLDTPFQPTTFVVQSVSLSEVLDLSHPFCLPFEDLFPPQFYPPSRPNTDPHINLAPENSADLPSVTSSLNRDAWAFFLRDYPDPTFVSSILHIIDHGANIGFTGDRSISQHSCNLPSALQYPDALAKGRIRGPFPAPPFPHFRSSPLGLAIRKHSGKLRQIHHLSWPRGTSVNDGIPDLAASITYEMFDRAVADLVASGPSSLMIKLDLEQAFHHIPIRPADWPLLGYEWGGQFFYELFLMFGLRSAPYIFNLFAEALHWILQHHIPARICHYLDDFLKMFPPNTNPDLVQAALAWVQALACALGLNFQDSKVVGPTYVLEFLGITLDSLRMEARLPLEKLAFLQTLLATWRSKSHCTQRELSELTGYLQFCSQVIPYSRAFLRSMFDFSSSFRTPFAHRRIPRVVRRDIEWWAMFSPAWNGILLISPTRETLHIHTDASGSKGAGGIFDSHWFSTRIPTRYKLRDIQFKEFYTIIQAILRWGPYFSGKHIVFHTDNQGVDAAIRNLSIRSPPTKTLVRQFVGLACRLDFTFESSWISTHDNAIADAASRFQFTRMFELAPYPPHTPSPILLSLSDSLLDSNNPRPSSFF